MLQYKSYNRTQNNPPYTQKLPFQSDFYTLKGVRNDITPPNLIIKNKDVQINILFLIIVTNMLKITSDCAIMKSDFNLRVIVIWIIIDILMKCYLLFLKQSRRMI